MNKTQLIEKIAQDSALSKAASGRVLDAFTDTIVQALQNNDQVTLIGFGSFSTRTRASRSGRNPKTGEVLLIPEASVPVFKAGKNLKQVCNE